MLVIVVVFRMMNGKRQSIGWKQQQRRWGRSVVGVLLQQILGASPTQIRLLVHVPGLLQVISAPIRPVEMTPAVGIAAGRPRRPRRLNGLASRGRGSLLLQTGQKRGVRLGEGRGTQSTGAKATAGGSIVASRAAAPAALLEILVSQSSATQILRIRRRGAKVVINFFFVHWDINSDFRRVVMLCACVCPTSTEWVCDSVTVSYVPKEVSWVSYRFLESPFIRRSRFTRLHCSTYNNPTDGWMDGCICTLDLATEGFPRRTSLHTMYM